MRYSNNKAFRLNPQTLTKVRLNVIPLLTQGVNGEALWVHLVDEMIITKVQSYTRIIEKWAQVTFLRFVLA